jgi:hypothetical protein
MSAKVCAEAAQREQIFLVALRGDFDVSINSRRALL